MGEWQGPWECDAGHITFNPYEGKCTAPVGRDGLHSCERPVKPHERRRTAPEAEAVVNAWRDTVTDELQVLNPALNDAIAQLAVALRPGGEQREQGGRA